MHSLENLIKELYLLKVQTNCSHITYKNTNHYYLKINKLAYEFYAFAKVVEKGFSVDFNNQTWGIILFLWAQTMEIDKSETPENFRNHK